MKIAQIAPIIERVPPKRYGGIERVIHALTEELVRRGHKITLFASGDSLTSAKLVSVYPRALREDKVKDLYRGNTWQLLNLGLAYSRQSEFEIIHDHVGYLSLATANLSKTPVVMTLHNPLVPENRKIYEVLGRQVSFVTISQAQSVTVPNLNYIGMVYNGLPMETYPFSPENDGYLLAIGRFSIEKGIHHAITVAQYLNLPLIIAAKHEPEVNEGYFEEYIEPRLSGQIRWLGEVGQDERNRLMSRALCLLHPVSYREPFGLTLIEAMACGTPVVAFRRGSIPEIIVNKKTGYIVEDMEEMIEAVTHIGEISREECRRYVLENFNVERMTDGYEEIYQKVLKNHPPNSGS